jgi:hypothetical protein
VKKNEADEVGGVEKLTEIRIALEILPSILTGSESGPTAGLQVGATFLDSWQIHRSIGLIFPASMVEYGLQ